MRLFLNVSVVLVCGALAGVSALAQSAPLHVGPAMLAAVTPTPAQPEASEILVRRSGGLEAHFDAANTSHDGHLTQAQAEQSDWTRVSKHFSEIDTDHKGWVSLDQIHSYNRSHRKHRKEAAA